MARRGTWHGVQCHAMPRFRVNVARHGAWRATRGAEIFTRATPCHVFKPTRHALWLVKTWHGVAWRATPGPKKTGGAITVKSPYYSITRLRCTGHLPLTLTPQRPHISLISVNINTNTGTRPTARGPFAIPSKLHLKPD